MFLWTFDWFFFISTCLASTCLPALASAWLIQRISLKNFSSHQSLGPTHTVSMSLRSLDILIAVIKKDTLRKINCFASAQHLKREELKG